jgi:hypothetical protein
MTAMVQQLETAPAEAREPSPAASLASLESAQPENKQADVPAGPASLWASESRVHYSITHTDQRDARAWIDCDCVIHSE